MKTKNTEYIKEGLRRMKIRKEKRINKLKSNIEKRRSVCTCGEDPYCYCGDGTPYSY